MKEKWTTQEIRSRKNLDNGQPIGQRISIFPESYRPKLSSSVKALDQYNSIITDEYSYDNVSYEPENETADNKSVYSNYTNSYYLTNTYGRNGNVPSFEGVIHPKTIYTTNSDNLYDYATVRSNSVAGTSTVDSDADNFRKEVLGSSDALLKGPRVMSCGSWFTYIEMVLCTISLSAGWGNIYRLTQTTLIQGGLPFLLAYVVLTLFVGFPILFLELGLGQLVQEGFTKTWRAVPLLKGVTYIKFLSLCLISLYYPLYIGLFIFYLIWYSTEGAPPFVECTTNNTEYTNETIYLSGQECLRTTFLESPYVNPKWFGIYIALLMIIWVITSILLSKRTKAFVLSLMFLILIMIGCFIALAIKAVNEDVKYSGLEKLLSNVDWSLLATSNVWYFGIIQTFFSTTVAMGPFVTNAGIIYRKSNIFWVALSITFLSLIFGISSVVLTYTMSGNLNLTLSYSDIPEVHMIALIYSSALQYSSGSSQLWAIIIISVLICSGFISTITIVYSILKAVRVESRKGWSWWRSLVLASVTGIILGSAALLIPEFKFVRLLDHYIVGNLIIICSILEVAAIVSYYGTRRLRLDFEFLLGCKLPILNIILWWLIPIILLIILLWYLGTGNLIGTIRDDPLWVYTTGWSAVCACLIFIALTSFYQIYKQDEYYNCKDKIKASTKPLRKWGPIDPMMRYNWVQWHSNAKKGVRDFTLKRRGTKEYTHSIKKNKLSQARNIPNLNEEITPSAINNDLNQNNIRLSTASSQYIEPLSTIDLNNVSLKPTLEPVDNYDDQMRVTYCFDAINSPNRTSVTLNNSEYRGKSNGQSLEKTFNNPLSNPGFNQTEHDVNNVPSNGYGTFRNGPFIIGDHFDPMVYRRACEFEESTEL